jgi:hypothetical protein
MRLCLQLLLKQQGVLGLRLLADRKWLVLAACRECAGVT